MTNYKEKAVAALLVTTMLGSATALPAPAWANTTASADLKAAKEAFDLRDLGKEIKFLGENTISLKNVQLIPTKGGQVLYTTFEVKNKSAQALDFYPYWIQMQSTNNARFPVSFVDEGQGNKVLPSSSKTFSYYTLVPNQITAEDLVVRLIKWDFTTANYQRQIYTFKLPEKFVLSPIEKGKRHAVDVDGVKVGMALTSSQMVTGSSSKQVRLRVSQINQGLRPVQVPNYEYVLRSGDGYTYPVTYTPTDEPQNLLPKLEKSINLTAELPVDADIESFELIVSEPKEELTYEFSVPLASFDLGLADQDQSESTGKGETHALEVDGEPIGTTITDVLLINDGNNRDQSKIVRVSLNFENQGVKAVDLPAYRYSMTGSNGYTYPVTARGNGADTELRPKFKKSIDLIVELPADEQIEDFELVISEPQEEGSSQQSFPLASFELDVEQLYLNFTEIGRTTNVKIDGYEYELSMENIHAYPAASSFDNILSYEIKLKNPNNYTVPFPQLGGRLNFIGQQTVPAKALEPTESSLYANQEVSVHMWGKVPDDVNIRQLIIHLQDMQTTEEGQTIDSGDLAVFNVLSRNIRLPQVAHNDAHQSSYIGRESTMKLHSTGRYSVSGSNIITTSFLVENKDNRPIKVPSFQGYFETRDGDIFPAYLKNKDQLISPRGSAIVTYWTELSTDMELRDLSLVLGQPLQEDSEIMTNAVSFKVTRDNQGIPNPGAPTYHSDGTFSHRLGGVSITIGRMMPNYEQGNIQYQFSKSRTSVIDDGSEKSLTFEVVKSNGDVVHTQTLNVEADGNSKSGTEYINFSPDDVQYIRVYENFENGRRQIANFSMYQ
ncbi:hypothetical protein [Bacillus horti]|uniref:Uncharacterized protein n=1 Tax=Caldalkalibacillus horti TaxID=77523 RepID=A0ABT9W2A0_9BACI|nr:hypothetical protein [Bacillus horti]MDQ0167383.1 hypothetical protein [Bacillus horti]